MINIANLLGTDAYEKYLAKYDFPEEYVHRHHPSLLKGVAPWCAWNRVSLILFAQRMVAREGRRTGNTWCELEMRILPPRMYVDVAALLH